MATFTDNITRYLRKKSKSGKPVSVYALQDAENCDVGYVLDASRKQLLLASMDPQGRYDGYIAYRMKDIHRLDYDGLYERNCHALYRLQEQEHEPVRLKEKSHFVNLLKHAKRNGLVVTVVRVRGQDHQVTGLVDDVEKDGTVKRLVIDWRGREDGKAVFSVDEIVRVYCDDSDEHTRMLLQKLYKSKKTGSEM